jgi:hypothetical protein
MVAELRIYPSDSGSACLFDGDLGGAFHHEMTHAAIAMKQRRTGLLALDPDVRPDVETARVDATGKSAPPRLRPGPDGAAPSKRRSCGAVSSAALSGSTGTPSSCVQANTPRSRASVASAMLLRTLARPTSNSICNSPSVTVMLAEAGSFAGDRGPAAPPRHCTASSRRSSCASHDNRILETFLHEKVPTVCS